MIHHVAPVEERDWETMRSIRLRALADSPSSFGSTLAREEAFPEATWRERARGTATTRLFMAWLDGAAIGIAGVFDEGDGTVQVVSVWVDPSHRGRGVANDLTAAALDFAGRNGVAIARLWVTDGNATARRLYERFGFTPTGRHQALPSDPSLQEHEMQLDLRPGSGTDATRRSLRDGVG